MSYAVEACSCFGRVFWFLFLADGVTVVFVFLKKVILAAEWKMVWKLEGQDRRGHRENSQQVVVTVLQERDGDGSCDLSSDSSCREKVSYLCHLESRIDRTQCLNGYGK